MGMFGPGYRLGMRAKLFKKLSFLNTVQFLWCLKGHSGLVHVLLLAELRHMYVACHSLHLNPFLHPLSVWPFKLYALHWFGWYLSHFPK